ncbi:MAG: fibronectin type III domain-containing protein [Deltaproteobacteria bacterium]|nr:fibronectin type III domain-containing protein [Deltaproteobacteria bacterium]
MTICKPVHLALVLSLHAVFSFATGRAHAQGNTAAPMPVTTHPLSAVIIVPDQRNFFDKPISGAACDAPEAVQVQFNLTAINSPTVGTLSIFVRASADCSMLPTDANEIINHAPTVNTLGAPDNFPKPIDPNILSTKSFLDKGGLCGMDRKQLDLTEYRLCVVYKNTGDSNPATNQITDFIQVRIDTKPPGKLTDVTVTPGDGSLSLAWTPVDKDFLATYTITVRAADGSDDRAPLTVTAPASSARIDGLPNGVDYEVTVAATDIAGNVGEPSDVVVGQGVPTCDFWSCYQGRETGGFCFVSTAAYGSYDAPFVQVFRDFRDRVMMKTAAGRALVLYYYRHGLPMALWIAKHEVARNVAAALLVVPYVAVWPIVRLRPLAFFSCAAFFFLAAALAWRLLSRRRLAAAAIFGVALLGASAVRADELNELVERDEDSGPKLVVPPPRFEFGLKLGPYYPSIDSDADAQGYYAAFFGDARGWLISRGSKLRVDASADVYVLQKYGLLGFTGTIGFWQTAGYSRICPDRNACLTSEGLAAAEKSSDKVLFTIIPLSIGIVYKLDIFWRRWGIPLIPYVRGGIDAYFWRVDNGTKQARKPGSVYANDGKPNGFAHGVTFGWHVSPGLAFALDIIEPNAARRAYTFMGIKGSYLTFEWMFSGIDDFGSATSWNLSQSTFQGGLAVEF